jgi:tetratricopeptide (TPR) repeat protein
MQHDLAFVQNQLWAVIALIGLFIVTNFLCNLQQRKRKSDLLKMWDRNELDKLLEACSARRKKFPNHPDGYYFAAKALAAKHDYPAAKAMLERLMEIEPKLGKPTIAWIDAIDHDQQRASAEK